MLIFVGCENIESPPSVDPSVDSFVEPLSENLSCESQFDNFKSCVKKQMESYIIPCEEGFIKGQSIVGQVKVICERGLKKDCQQWDLVPFFYEDIIKKALTIACSGGIKV